ncbi:MAG: hypothetical protein ACP5N1_02370 [Candidatus Woesearchaeota archaeon]
MSNINQKILDYIKKYTDLGYNISDIRQFLLNNNIPQNDVDQAIIYLSQSKNALNQTSNNQNTNQNSNTNTNKPNASNIPHTALEIQLRNYIQTQSRNGYSIELIKNSLIRQGFDSQIVYRIANEYNNVNINVKHEVNISKSTIFGIIAALFIITIVTYGIFNFDTFKSNQALLDVSVSSNSYSYLAGENINYQLHISNMGSEERFDATIKYLVVDDSSNIITRKEETIAVETTASINRNIQLPTNIKEGKYHLQVILDYGRNQQAKSSLEFEVVKVIIPNTNRNTTSAISEILNNTSNNNNDNIDSPTINNNNIESQIPEYFRESFGDTLVLVKETARNNPNSAAKICSDLESDSKKDLCYGAVADVSLMSNYCELIINIENQDNCYLSFAMRGNAQACTNIINSESRSFCDQLIIVQLMDKYYKENNTEKILELSRQFNPEIYDNNPITATFEYTYTEVVTGNIMDVMSVPEEIIEITPPEIEEPEENSTVIE